MANVGREPAPREDSRFWYIDRDLTVTKPGDIVEVTCVLGDRFGSFDEMDDIGKAAVFLGQFPDDKDDATIEIAQFFMGEEAVAALTPEEIDDISKMPYFRADFDGLAELVFAGIECFWRTSASKTD